MLISCPPDCKSPSHLGSACLPACIGQAARQARGYRSSWTVCVERCYSGPHCTFPPVTCHTLDSFYTAEFFV